MQTTISSQAQRDYAMHRVDLITALGIAVCLIVADFLVVECLFQ
jgi:hypothetical protein